MAITRIASQDATGTGTAASSVSATYATTPTANNLLIAVVGDTDGNLSATAITGWTQADNFSQSITNEAYIFYKVATGAESTTVTASTTAGTTSCMAIYEYTGLVTTSVNDKIIGNGSDSSNTCAIGPTATTTVASELLICCGFTTGAAVTFSSWSNSFNLRNSVIQTTFGLFVGDQIVSSKAAYSTTLTVSGTVTTTSGIICTFKGKSGVSGLSILGAG